MKSEYRDIPFASQWIERIITNTALLLVYGYWISPTIQQSDYHDFHRYDHLTSHIPRLTDPTQTNLLCNYPEPVCYTGQLSSLGRDCQQG